MNRKLLAFFFVAILSGCGEKTPVQTVEWYKEHDAERQAMIGKCQDNPGELAASANCVNAKQAQNEKDLARRGTLRLLKPKPGKGKQP
jgi:hypothetical protein